MNLYDYLNVNYLHLRVHTPGMFCTCFCVCFGIQEYGADGLRTLALAFRDLSEEEWEVWSESQRLADKATDFREDRLAAVYDKIEQDMMVSPKTKLNNYWFKRVL